MIFRRFPYTTLNDINLDWIIKQVKQIAAALQSKQDKPDSTGTTGQVLGLDENLDPVWLDQTGGGGGTTNYNNLTNKPQINGVTLSGNKTAADLGLAAARDIPTVPVQSVNGETGAVVLDAADVGALPSNTFIPTGSLQPPLMDGEASAGSTTARYALEGHIHPTDTSRASAAELATYTRPNLLDNWYFVGGGSQRGFGTFPINQRKQTSYSNINNYTLDRWKLTNGSVTLSAAGITLNGTITQTLTASIDQTVTASALLSDGTMFSPTYNDNTKTLTLTATGQTITAVKLEIGNTQTLAHQENGTWVLNEFPKYADEMAKCQAFLFPVDKFYTFRSTFSTYDRIDFCFSLPVQLARIPTILNADLVVLDWATNTTLSSFTSAARGQGPLLRIAISASNITERADYELFSNTDWFLSAEN